MRSWDDEWVSHRSMAVLESDLGDVSEREPDRARLSDATLTPVIHASGGAARLFPPAKSEWPMRQSDFAPDSLTILPHLSISARMNAPNCSGVEAGFGSAPISPRG